MAGCGQDACGERGKGGRRREDGLPARYLSAGLRHPAGALVQGSTAGGRGEGGGGDRRGCHHRVHNSQHVYNAALSPYAQAGIRYISHPVPVTNTLVIRHCRILFLR